MTTLIKGGTVVSSTGADPADVLIDGEQIAAVLQPGSDIAAAAVAGAEVVEVTGHVDPVYSRGRKIMDDGQYLGRAGDGQYLPRGLCQYLQQGAALSPGATERRDSRPDRRTENMDFGVVLQTDPPAWRVVDLAQRAETLGFTYGWTFDSHVLWQEPYVIYSHRPEG